VFRGVLDANPDNYSVQALLCLNEFSENGSTAGFDAYNRLNPDPAQRPVYLYMKGNCAAARGDFATLFQANREQRYYDDDPDNPRWSQDAAVAEAYAEAGDMKAARQRANETLALIKAQLAHQSDNPTLWSTACLAQALLGNRQEALLAARRFTEVMPESRDALFGPQNAQVVALGFAWAGEKARALAEVERLLQVPWGLNVYVCRASFLPLRDDPRFKALMADPKNNAPMF
jgi:tetratricopeptide (TPR) repeat protein